MTDIEPAPGWDAIDAALATLYPGVEPRHVAYNPPRGLDGGALQGCSAYPAPGHWHYVTYGLSELYVAGPEDDPEWSGWGFELTLRVARGPEDHAPNWPFSVLQGLARWVHTDRVLLGPGHHITLGRPITGHPDVPDAPPSELTAYALAPDPQLGRIATPNGKVTFLQAVGVTDQEKAAIGESGTADVLAALAVENPLLITDPRRG